MLLNCFWLPLTFQFCFSKGWCACLSCTLMPYALFLKYMCLLVFCMKSRFRMTGELALAVQDLDITGKVCVHKSPWRLRTQWKCLLRHTIGQSKLLITAEVFFWPLFSATVHGKWAKRCSLYLTGQALQCLWWKCGQLVKREVQSGYTIHTIS